MDLSYTKSDYICPVTKNAKTCSCKKNKQEFRPQIYQPELNQDRYYFQPREPQQMTLTDKLTLDHMANSQNLFAIRLMWNNNDFSSFSNYPPSYDTGGGNIPRRYQPPC